MVMAYPVSSLTEIIYKDSPYGHQKTGKRNGCVERLTQWENLQARILLLAGVVLLSISPVAATDRIAIDPVPANLTAGSIIEFTGTTTLPAGTSLQYGFSRTDAGNGSVRSGEYSGTEGTVPVEKGTAGQIWKVPILTQGYAPADYTFRIGTEGDGDRVSVQVRISPKDGSPVPTTAATERSTCPEFRMPVYVSPGGTFIVKTVPDLNARCSILAKGSLLEITVATASGNPVGIWITSASPATGYTRFRMISADRSGTAAYDLPDTAALRSGQYFIYVVDGGKSLEVRPGENESSAYISGDDLETRLKAYEKQNPYQKFMILLEEPVITINENPDAVSGTPVEVAGTTNLNAGTLLDIEVVLAEIDRPKQPAFAISGVPVTEGTAGHSSWRTVINTSSLPPGEYVVKVHHGTTEATGLMVLYDRLYDTGVSSKESLVAKTYDVDPETKTVVTGTPAPGAGLPADPGILALLCSAGIICLGAIVYTRRKK